jgi:thiol-disulfide isomerase/thioredoxin
MSEPSGAKPRVEERGGGFLKWALWGVALFGVVAVLFIIVKVSAKPEPEIHEGPIATPAPAAKTVAQKLQHPADGQAGPAYAFTDEKGRKLTVADLKGKVVVLNLWATWCAPCKLEMPTLAKLQAEYADKPVEVVAVSIDKADKAAEARAFIASHAPLKFYSDPDAKMPWQLKPIVEGMPTTVIYGRDGLERGRVSGEADWSGAAAKAVIDKVLQE